MYSSILKWETAGTFEQLSLEMLFCFTEEHLPSLLLGRWELGHKMWGCFCSYSRTSDKDWKWQNCTESGNCWGWQGPLKIIWSNPLLKQGQLSRTVSRWFLIVFMDGDSPASLGNLLQCLTNLILKKWPRLSDNKRKRAMRVNTLLITVAKEFLEISYDENLSPGPGILWEPIFMRCKWPEK